MQIVSIGDNLHVMSKSVFWEKYEKYSKMSAEIFTQSAKFKATLTVFISVKKQVG